MVHAHSLSNRRLKNQAAVFLLFALLPAFPCLFFGPVGLHIKAPLCQVVGDILPDLAGMLPLFQFLVGKAHILIYDDTLNFR